MLASQCCSQVLLGVAHAPRRNFSAAPVASRQRRAACNAAHRSDGDAGAEQMQRRQLLSAAAGAVMLAAGGAVQAPAADAVIEGYEPMPGLQGKDYGKPRMKFNDYVQTPSGLQYQDFKVGTGPTPKEGQTCVLDWGGYTIGYYGRPFEARNKPKGGAFTGDEKEFYRFVLGAHTVIPAIEEAVAGMQVGGIRRIIVPVEIGYPDNDYNKQGPRPTTFSGQRALGFVLGNQGLIDKTLLFDLELISVRDEESEERMQKLVARFEAADKDGNGVIDKDELRKLLERVGDGDDEVPLSWLTDEDVAEVLEQYDTNGDGVISFEEFVRMAQDKIFLTGKLEEYRDAFKAVDAGGNGTISATELFRLFERIGHPISYEKLVVVMEEYDVDQSGVIDFGEFLRMFRGELLDLEDIVSYIKRRTAGKAASLAARAQAITVEQLAAASHAAAEVSASSASPTAAADGAAAAATAEAGAGAEVAEVEQAVKGAKGPRLLPGGVNLFFSEADLDLVLASNPGKLVVLMASLTWCRPCKAFQDSYEKAAQHYKDCIFLKFYGNSNEGTKALFKERLKCRTTPSFFFFKDGAIVGSCTGANTRRLETNLRQAYGESEPPAQAPLWLASTNSQTEASADE